MDVGTWNTSSFKTVFCLSQVPKENRRARERDLRNAIREPSARILASRKDRETCPIAVFSCRPFHNTWLESWMDLYRNSECMDLPAS